MALAYWIVAGILALFYIFSGGMKVSQSQEKLAPMMAWAGTAVPMAGVRAIGALEILGAAALILVPLISGPVLLVVLAAVGLLTLQVLAAGFHLVRRETHDLWLNVVLILMAALTAWLATL